jgi:hypothetical protein
VTTGGHDAYPRAIREELGVDVKHRTNRYLNNWIEQDHREIKQRYGPMRGFGSFKSAGRFCRAFDELRSFYRVPGTRGTKKSLAGRRQHHRERTATPPDPPGRLILLCTVWKPHAPSSIISEPPVLTEPAVIARAKGPGKGFISATVRFSALFSIETKFDSPIASA